VGGHPAFDAEGSRVLPEVFGFHPRAVADCEQRNPVPKAHVYSDHVFVVLHAPEPGAGGHVHYVELDQFIGPNYYVTVHGPLNPAVEPDAALVETGRWPAGWKLAGCGPPPRSTSRPRSSARSPDECASTSRS
jgi:hypothetical protein